MNELSFTHTHTLLSFLIIRKLLFYSFFISEPSHLFLLHASTHSRCHLLLVFRSPPDLKTKPRFKEHEEKKPQSSSSPGPWLYGCNRKQIHRVSDGPSLAENSFRAAPQCLLGSQLSLILRYKHAKISSFGFFSDPSSRKLHLHHRTPALHTRIS